MPIPQEIDGILYEFGLPVTAVGLALGLVRGARALETGANPRALDYVAGLLTAGTMASLGRAGATLVPFIFDRVFGHHILSWKFISRSVLATTMFWLSLLGFKHPAWSSVYDEIANSSSFYFGLVVTFYFFDWVSLVKAKLIIRILSQRHAVKSAIMFLFADILGSYLISLLALITLFCALKSIVYNEWPDLTTINPTFQAYMHFPYPVIQYFRPAGDNPFLPSQVVVPSTMLTSIWTLLLLLSSLIAQLLIPVDYLRKFTVWWFRDLEAHPLTAVAKVGATLIIVLAMTIKAVASLT